MAQIKSKFEELRDFISGVLSDLALGMPSSRVELHEKRNEWLALNEEFQRYLGQLVEKGPTLVVALKAMNNNVDMPQLKKALQCEF